MIVAVVVVVAVHPLNMDADDNFVAAAASTSHFLLEGLSSPQQTIIYHPHIPFV